MEFREPKRARRRRDLLRMKAKARRIYPHWPRAHTHANHLASCSRWCCANPRHVFGEISIAERRADLTKRDDAE